MRWTWPGFAPWPATPARSCWRCSPPTSAASWPRCIPGAAARAALRSSCLAGAASSAGQPSNRWCPSIPSRACAVPRPPNPCPRHWRSEEHTSELQSPCNLVCRLLLEKKKISSPLSCFHKLDYHMYLYHAGYQFGILFLLELCPFIHCLVQQFLLFSDFLHFSPHQLFA